MNGLSEAPEIEEMQNDDSKKSDELNNITCSNKGNIGRSFTKCERNIIFNLSTCKPRRPFPKYLEKNHIFQTFIIYI